jgi:hypothetical protein
MKIVMAMTATVVPRTPISLAADVTQAKRSFGCSFVELSENVRRGAATINPLGAAASVGGPPSACRAEELSEREVPLVLRPESRNSRRPRLAIRGPEDFDVGLEFRG